MTIGRSRLSRLALIRDRFDDRCCASRSVSAASLAIVSENAEGDGDEGTVQLVDAGPRRRVRRGRPVVPPEPVAADREKDGGTERGCWMVDQPGPHDDPETDEGQSQRQPRREARARSRRAWVGPSPGDACHLTSAC